ncbi:MAG: type IV toxin-antitoxin system AbiEi family antitoxin [Flavobacteriaceae bacterium]|nr:type IV toxin-antitoxin system AbiEi family antitoxin [Flavobacteriaceae bacterium]
MTVADYIKQCLSVEEYSFSLTELQTELDKSEASIKSELSRLIEKKTIVNLRKGFYLIIPPRYSKQGQVPIQLYIEKLFKYLNRNYYLGFYSAAKFHGASHQQTQRDYLMTKKPKLIDIKKNTFDIRFFTTSKWSNKNILDRKSDAGIFKISSPALTAVDLIHHQTKLGGLNRMLAILEELAEELNQNDIAELLTWYPNKSTLQRFGFLLEEVGADENFSNQIKKHLKKSKFFPVLLSPKTGQNPGAVDNFWKVAINIKLESDL